MFVLFLDFTIFVLKTSLSMNLFVRLLFFVFLLLSCFSCQSNGKYKIQLAQIEELVDSVPQLAIEELDKLRLHISEAPKEEQMKYTLLRVKAEDKLFVLQKSDSTMLAVVDYYEHHGTDEDRLLSYYLLAAAYRDMQDSPKAIEYYMKATEFGEEHMEFKYHPALARSYGQLHGLLDQQGNFSEALLAAKKQYLHCSPDDHDAAHELGEMFYRVGKQDSAIIYFDIARKNCLKNEKDPRWLMELLGSQLGNFVLLNDEMRIDECIQALKQYPETLYPIGVLNAFALYYYHYEKYDSACYYWEKGRNLAPTFNDLHSVDYSLMKAYQKRGMKDEALKYASEMGELTDSIYSNVVLQQSANAYNRYVYSQNEKQALLERQRFWLYAFAGYFVLSIASLLTLWFYYRNRTKLRETQKAQEILQRQNNELTEAKTSLETKLQNEFKQKDEIDARALAQVLYSHANESSAPTPLTKDQLKMVYQAIEVNFPDMVATINNTLPGISPFDRSLLYILKLGLNQSEAARLLNRKRSTISHRITVMESTYGIQPKNLLNIDTEFVRILHEKATY